MIFRLQRFLTFPASCSNANFSKKSIFINLIGFFKINSDQKSLRKNWQSKNQYIFLINQFLTNSDQLFSTFPTFNTHFCTFQCHVLWKSKLFKAIRNEFFTKKLINFSSPIWVEKSIYKKEKLASLIFSILLEFFKKMSSNYT